MDLCDTASELTLEKKKNAPRVSVVLPIDRIDPFLPAAIESILNQTFGDFELLLVLNVRLRAKRAELENIYGADHRVRFLEVPALGGLALALNIGIGEARGVYVARMDGDDISLPHRFEEQVRFLDAHPRVAVLGGRIELIDELSQKLPTKYTYYGTNDDILRILPFRNPMPHPALMMRHDAMTAAGGYKYGSSSEDYELFLRMSRNPDVEFANLDRVVLLYRRHSQQITNPEYFRHRFSDMTGFLITEAIYRSSPKYLLGILAIHPWSRGAKKFVERIRGR